MVAQGFPHGFNVIFMYVWIICLLSRLADSIGGVKTWSKWYDGKLLNGTNNGTLDRIRELFKYDCHDINNVECATKSSTTNETTTTTWRPDVQYFRLPCDSSAGNICTLINSNEWGLVIPCTDFEIRFLCQAPDSTKTEKTTPDPVNINGGFIAMAAGLSVVVPLICVLVMQLRRAKREERERERRRREGGGEDNPATDLPPSYEQVFGQNYHSVAPAVHSRNSSMDALIEENETLRSSATGSQPRGTYVAVRHPPSILNSHGELISNLAILEGTRSNPGYSEAPVATISGSQVADIAVTLLPPHVESTRVDILFSSGGPDNTDHSSQVTAVLSDDHVASSSSSQTTPSSPPPAPPPPPPPLPRSPPPPFSSWSFRNSNRNNRSGIGSSQLQETLRRLPGMHISIEDFFASLRGLQDNENEGPPPSYEEALKILELAALAKERLSIIT